MIRELRVETVKPLERMPKPASRITRHKPLAEGLIPLDENGQRGWLSCSDNLIVSYALIVIAEKGIESRGALQEEDPSLYQILRKRGLMDRTKLRKKKLGKWTEHSDEELIGYTQRFVDDKGIMNIRGLMDEEISLYGVLYRRKLLAGVNFPKTRRSWTGFSDKELVALAKEIMREKELEKKSELFKENKSLYQALTRRELLDRINFRK